MTKRERVIAAIQHEETDFVPYQVMLTKQEHARCLPYFKDEDFEQHFGNHIDLASFSAGNDEIQIKPDYFMDDYGVVWNRTGVDKDIGVVDNILLKDRRDLIGFNFPNINEELVRSRFSALINNVNDTFKIGRISAAMYERAWSLRGIENLLVDMIEEPEFVDELLDAILRYDMAIVKIGLEYDIDGFYFGDDWGQQLPGLIMGPLKWRRFIKPRMATLYAEVKKAGKFVVQHSCGNNMVIFNDLADIGMDVYQTVQPEIYDLNILKMQYGRLGYWGAISTQRLLPFAGPDEVRRVCAHTLHILGRGGGYIAGPTHWLPGDIPPENVEAMLDVFRNQRQYAET